MSHILSASQSPEEILRGGEAPKNLTGGQITAPNFPGQSGPLGEIWQGNKCSVTNGPLLQAIGQFQEDGAYSVWELLRADICEGELKAMLVILLRSWFRGQPNAELPVDGDETFASLVCLDWKNLQFHVQGCIKKGMIIRKVYENGSAAYTPIYPSNWSCAWRKKRLEAVAVLESLSQKIPVEIQLLINFGPLDTFEGRGRRTRKTESQNKTGEERPSIQKSETQKTPDLPCQPQAAISESQQKPLIPPKDLSSNRPPHVPGNSEIQPGAFKDSNSFNSTKLLTDEALKALKRGSTDPAHPTHLASLTAEEKREYCRGINLTKGMEETRRLMCHVMGGKDSTDWKNWGGKNTNAIKIDCAAMQSACEDVSAQIREGRKASNTVGTWIMDAAMRFSTVLKHWYPPN